MYVFVIKSTCLLLYCLPHSWLGVTRNVESIARQEVRPARANRVSSANFKNESSRISWICKSRLLAFMECWSEKLKCRAFYLAAFFFFFFFFFASPPLVLQQEQLPPLEEGPLPSSPPP